MELDTFRIAEVQKSAKKLSHGLEFQVEMKVAFSYLHCKCFDHKDYGDWKFMESSLDLSQYENFQN